MSTARDLLDTIREATPSDSYGLRDGKGNWPIPGELTALLTLLVGAVEDLDAATGYVADGGAATVADAGMARREAALAKAEEFFVNRDFGYSVGTDVIPLARFLLGEAP